MRSALNVAALNCLSPEHANILPNYKLFLENFDGKLDDAQDKVEAEFREKYGDRRTGRAELDNYMTKVYNYFTLPPAKEAFCDAALEMSNESVMVAPADLGSFSARALTRFEGVFEDFFRAFERYETNVATWDRLYGTPAGLYPATRPATQVAENDTVETGNGVRMLDAPIAQPGEGTSGAVNLGSRGGPQDAGTQTAEAPAVEAAPGTADPAIAEEPVIVLPEAVATTSLEKEQGPLASNP